MARMTREEKEAQRLAELEVWRQEQRALYPARFRNAVNNALKVNFELLSVDETGKYTWFDRDSDETHVVWDNFMPEGDDMLDHFIWAVNTKAALRAEEERKFQVKRAALAKLSAEERELLGL